MIRAIIAVIRGAIAGMIGIFIVDKSVDVATDERVHRGGRGCLAVALGVLDLASLG